MTDITDVQGFERDLEHELEKLDQHHPDDRPMVKRFVTAVDGKVEVSTLQVYLRNLRRVANLIDGPLIELTEAELDEYVFDWRRDPALGMGDDPGFSDGTIRNYQFAVRKFLSEVDVDADWVDDYELVPPPENRVQPEDMLTPADVAALTNGANNLRDIALIEFLADTGARLSLVASLRVGDVDLEGPRATYTPNGDALGLKGAAIQPYPIIDSKTILQNYLRTVHPRPERDDVALFHKVAGHGNEFDEDDSGSLAPHSIRKQIRKAADNAGVEKPVNPHNFRHSAVTRMRREGWDRAEVEHRVHWDVDTDMWRVYEHISGEQHNEAIWQAAGIADEDDDGPSRERIPCPNCREPVAPQYEWCGRCGEAVSGEARRIQQQAISSLADALAEVDDSKRRQLLAAALQQVEEDPSVLDTHDSLPSSTRSS